MAAAVIGSALQQIHSRSLHDAQLEQTKLLYQHEMQQTMEHHERELSMKAEFHKAEMLTTRQLHAAAMKVLHDIARREENRDLYTQRTQFAQTLLIVESLLLACNFSTLLDGNFIINDAALTTVYSSLLSASLGLMLGAILACFKLQSALAGFRFKDRFARYRPCGKKHTEFSEYFACHCLYFQNFSWNCCTSGTVLGLAAASLRLSGRFFVVHHDVPSAIIFCIVLGFLLIGAPLGLGVVSRCCRAQSRSSPPFA
jgi:hypothetical protein